MKESDKTHEAMMELKKTIETTLAPTMYLMVGLPRSGKSTWIKNNKDRLNAIVLENDWIRENILHAPHSKSIDPAIWMITDASARILLSQGKNVIIDGVHLTPFVRKFFVDLAKECDSKIVMVKIDTCLEECLKRNRYSYKLPDDVLKKMHAGLEEPLLHEYDELIIVKE